MPSVVINSAFGLGDRQATASMAEVCSPLRRALKIWPSTIVQHSAGMYARFGPMVRQTQCQLGFRTV